MIQLHDAITSVFPQGNDWAAEALELLSDELEPTTLVHAVVEGWLQRQGPDGPQLVDTLFVLTDSRLGLGRLDEAPGERRWVQLSDVVAVDAIDDSLLPLQTIELELADGLVLCVGWPESFTDRFVPVLMVAVEEGSSDTLPHELANPSMVADDPAGLDSLGPSEWIEGELTAPAIPEPSVSPVPAPPASPIPTAAAPAPAIPLPGRASAPDTLQPATPSTPLDQLAAPTGPPVPLLRGPAPAEPPAAADGTDGALPADVVETSPADLWLTIDHRRDNDPLPPGAFDDAQGLHAGAVSEPSAKVGHGVRHPHDPALDAPSPLETPPWQMPARIWPEPIRGVQYLGGHPAHPRKRKNGSMFFTGNGIVVSGTGFQNWEMVIDWAFVDTIDIQGPDEVLFGDDVRIDSTSSALIVGMEDGTRMFFEIRTRRPPSLRSGLAPVLMMTDEIRTYRAHA